MSERAYLGEVAENVVERRPGIRQDVEHEAFDLR